MTDKFEAISKLVSEHPNAFRLFGDHKSSDHFELLLLSSHMDVREEDGCWIIIEKLSPSVGSVHWFCPDGVRIGAVRKMIRWLFSDGYQVLTGTTPPEVPAAKQARVLNRAIGARKIGDSYVLTLHRFMDYNSKRKSY